jgi:hypothetical protein
VDEPDDQGGNRQTLHYESHEQLRVHLADFMAAYDFARRLKTLSGFTPYALRIHRHNLDVKVR